MELNKSYTIIEEEIWEKTFLGRAMINSTGDAGSLGSVAIDEALLAISLPVLHSWHPQVPPPPKASG